MTLIARPFERLREDWNNAKAQHWLRPMRSWAEDHSPMFRHGTSTFGPNQSAIPQAQLA